MSDFAKGTNVHSKDVIYRQDAINLLKKWADGYKYIETETELAIKEFEQLPSARPDVPDKNVGDTISRQAAIDALTENKEMVNAVLDSLTLDYNTRRNQEQRRGQINEDIETIKALPSAQSKSWEDERKKIADALSEKMAYMNTCLNERDIILGYLGVKRPNEPHCNSDCRNEKCESYHYATKELPSPCDLCSNLEKGDTLYQYSDWDGGIGFDYIWDIQYCPKCGRRLE